MVPGTQTVRPSLAPLSSAFLGAELAAAAAVAVLSVVRRTLKTTVFGTFAEFAALASASPARRLGMGAFELLFREFGM